MDEILLEMGEGLGPEEGGCAAMEENSEEGEGERPVEGMGLPIDGVEY